MARHTTNSHLNPIPRRMALELSGLALLIATLYVGLTWFSARQVDEQALEQSTRRVQDMLERAQRVQIAVSEEYGWWDDLIIALETNDLDWLALEFDQSIYKRYGVTEVLALTHSGTPIYAAKPLSTTPSPGTLGWDLHTLEPLIKATQSSSLEFPESASDILIKDGVMYVVTAAALTRYEYSLTDVSNSARSILLLMAPIDANYLDEKAPEIQVQELKWSATAPISEAALPVRNTKGELQAYLSWTIARPGAAIISTAAMWSAPIFLLSIALGTLLLRRFQTLTERSRLADIRSLALEQSQSYFQAMSDNAPVLIWQTDIEGRITYKNNLFIQFLEELGTNNNYLRMTDLESQGSERGLQNLIDMVMESDGPVQKEQLLTGNKNESRWLSIVGVKQQVSDADASSTLFSATDVTDRKNTELLIWKQANFDALTGLANRSLLLDRLAQELASTKRDGGHGAIMFIDLDNFKTINDSLGHTVGDQVLQGVAHRISDCVRDRDTVARFGGDEFIVLLPGASDQAQLNEVAQRIRQSLIHDVPLGDSDRFVTASIGVAYYPENGNDSDLLLNRADKAMYRAKSDGRNKIAFHEAA